MGNLLIINKKANAFEGLIIDANGVKTADAAITVNEIHTCLYCESLRNITIVVNGADIYTATFVFEDEAQFKAALKDMKAEWKTVEFSEQNKKINGYAKALVEKLEAGIQLTIIDSSDEVKEIICPDCGMQCDPNIPYCMECGASV